MISQLCSAYLIAVLYFGERQDKLKNAALFVAAASYIFLYMSLSFNMGETDIRNVYKHIVDPKVLCICAVFISIYGFLRVVAEPVVAYTVAAAFVDALHFPSTRLLGKFTEPYL